MVIDDDRSVVFYFCFPRLVDVSHRLPVAALTKRVSARFFVCYNARKSGEAGDIAVPQRTTVVATPERAPEYTHRARIALEGLLTTGSLAVPPVRPRLTPNGDTLAAENSPRRPASQPRTTLVSAR